MSEFTLKAKRNRADPPSLTIAYPTQQYAFAAAEIFRDRWPVVTITGPDGSIVLDVEKDVAGLTLK